jgi:hypothetical protein
VPNALRAAGCQVVVHDDEFRQDEADDVWIRTVAKRGLIILSKDLGIRYNPAERSALLESGARAFLLARGELKAAEMASIFLRALPNIESILVREVGPFVARVYRDGNVRIAYRL